ncbi:MAG: cell division protein FtsQ [Solirubrobacteraceae bacterium]|nr:cell division protein FtsQ [Solirubrobacteraceae bacterium]
MSLDSTLPRRRLGARTPLAERAAKLPRVPPRVLLAILALALVATGGYFWLRDSSLTQVRDVQVTGASTSEAAKVTSALESAAAGMSTLHVRMDALKAAVAPYASVQDLAVKPDFPHRLTITVIERKPVAVLQIGDQNIPATGSGLILRGVVADDGLPAIRVDAAPGGDHVDNANTRAALSIAASAPDVLRQRILRLWTGERGMMLSLENGPDLIFGDASDNARRWAAAARVLAEPKAAGATYLDVRIPGRVAAGGLGPVPDPTPTPTPQANPQP